MYQVIATLVTDEAGNASVDGGVDELVVDTLAPVSPGVTSLTVADRTPTIEGTATPAAGETLSVEVAGQVYLAGDGALVDNGDGTWTLTIPAGTPIDEGRYDVTAVVTDAAGNRSVDPSAGELTIDLTAPSAPTVTATTTNAAAPTIEGTATLGAGETLEIEVDGQVYSVGDGFLELDGSGGWTLTLPAAPPIGEGPYDVVATVTDAAGNATLDATTDELVVDRTATGAPTVTIAEDVNDDGTIAIAELLGEVDVTIGLPANTLAGDVLTVTIDGTESDRVLTSEEVTVGHDRADDPCAGRRGNACGECAGDGCGGQRLAGWAGRGDDGPECAADPDGRCVLVSAERDTDAERHGDHRCGRRAEP